MASHPFRADDFEDAVRRIDTVVNVGLVIAIVTGLFFAVLVSL